MIHDPKSNRRFALLRSSHGSISLRLGRLGCDEARLKDEPPKALTGSSGTSAAVLLQLENPLCLNNARSDKEDQLLVRGSDRAPFEQVAQRGNVAEQWNLLDADAVLRLDNTADHNRSAIGHQHLRGSLLSDQCRVALNSAAEVRSGVLHIHVQEDRVLRSNLRSHGQT